MNAKRLMLIAFAFGLLCFAFLAQTAQAQEFRGYTCGGLWEHVHAGGWVIFDETSRWFNSTCTGKSKAEDDEETGEAPARRPTVVTCAYLPARVAVYGHVRGTQCQMVGAVVISKNPELEARGFVDAVDVWSYVNGGIEVCFRNQGWLVFLDASYAPRMATELAPVNRDGMICGEIDRAGTVVLLREGPPTAGAPATLPVFVTIPLHDCQIKLVEKLFLRAAPAGEIIGLVWLNSEVPAFEINGFWYKIEFEGQTGYVSRYYREVLRGGCG